MPFETSTLDEKFNDFFKQKKDKTYSKKEEIDNYFKEKKTYLQELEDEINFAKNLFRITYLDNVITGKGNDNNFFILKRFSEINLDEILKYDSDILKKLESIKANAFVVDVIIEAIENRKLFKKMVLDSGSHTKYINSVSVFKQDVARIQYASKEKIEITLPRRPNDIISDLVILLRIHNYSEADIRNITKIFDKKGIPRQSDTSKLTKKEAQIYIDNLKKRNNVVKITLDSTPNETTMSDEDIEAKRKAFNQTHKNCKITINS